jgi:hypothetical protein
MMDGANGVGAAMAVPANQELLPAEVANAAAAERHVSRITGPTILMGDGSYFDYLDPASSRLTIEDYAYALAYTCRFRGQTRSRLQGGRRVFYSVAEHCERLARHLIEDGHGRLHAYAGLMHESGEVVWGDMPGPAKPLVPGFKDLERGAERAIGARFGVQMTDPVLIKRYDLCMLATEKRDLMPQSGAARWGNAEDCGDLTPFEPFPAEIIPYGHPDEAAERFLALYHELAAWAAGYTESVA